MDKERLHRIVTTYRIGKERAIADAVSVARRAVRESLFARLAWQAPGANIGWRKVRGRIIGCPQEHLFYRMGPRLFVVAGQWSMVQRDRIGNIRPA